jgi:hypothetical protein
LSTFGRTSRPVSTESKASIPTSSNIAAHEVFRPVNAKSVADPIPTAKFWNKAAKARVPLLEKRKKLRVGIPRVLNIYTYAPLFNGYLEVQEMAAG